MSNTPSHEILNLSPSSTKHQNIEKKTSLKRKQQQQFTSEKENPQQVLKLEKAEELDKQTPPSTSNRVSTTTMCVFILNLLDHYRSEKIEFSANFRFSRIEKEIFLVFIFYLLFTYLY